MEDNATETHNEKAITHNDYLIPIYYKVHMASPIKALPNTVATHLDMCNSFSHRPLSFTKGSISADG